jgi:hypothetical protein
MSFQPFKRSIHSRQERQSNGSSDLSSVINEEFLNLPSAQQRARLEAVTGNNDFLRLPEEELHKYIANAINHITRRVREHPGVHGTGDGVHTTPAVSTIDLEGHLHHVPHDQLPEALDAGHTIVMPMTHPDGTHGYVPLEGMRKAYQQGFEAGHKSTGDGNEGGWLSRTGDWLSKRAQSVGNWGNQEIEQGIDRFEGNRPIPPPSALPPKFVMPDPAFKKNVPQPSGDSRMSGLMQCVNQNFQVPFW